MTRLDRQSGEEAIARPAARATSFPLSLAQQRLWMLDQLERRSAAHNAGWAFHLSGPLDIAALERSVDDLVRRHEILRSGLRAVDGVMMQVVEPVAFVPVRIVDLADHAAAERDARLASVIADEASRPFDLDHAPLFRVLLIRTGAERHVLQLTAHRAAIGDAASLETMLGDLGTLYAARYGDAPSALADPAVQYGDVAVLEREAIRDDAFAADLAFWRERLATAPRVLDLPTDHPRHATPDYASATESLELSPHRFPRSRLDHDGDAHARAAPYLAAFALVLSRYSGRSDLVIGTTAPAWRPSGAEGVIGPFANMLALRMRLDGSSTVAALCAGAESALREAAAHARAPFARVLDELDVERDLAQSPVCQVTFDHERDAAPSLALDGLTVERVPVTPQATSYDLSLRVAESPGALLIDLEYRTELFERSTARRMLDHYAAALSSMLDDPERTIATVQILLPDERELVLREWNATAASFPGDWSVAALVEAQAARTPDATAIVSGAERLTYRELDERATALARRLRALGVGPDIPVAISLERTPAMVIALLAIWKAGGAYVPLDPEFPPARLELMLGDCGARVLLTERALVDRLPPYLGDTLLIDGEAPSVESPTADAPVVDASAEDLAYLIYTSGSTGRPKGVEVRHRGVVNLLIAFELLLGTTEHDVVMALTTLSFDIAGLELWLPLVTGATLVIVTRDVATDGGRLGDAIEAVGATLVQATPATWRLLLESGWRGRRGLTALCGGEALPSPLASALAAHCDRLWNVYGPTETTIWSTAYAVTRESLAHDGHVVPIGRPLANTSVYVLDASGGPVPIGVPGELYIGGVGVARGYRNRSDLTAERFVRDPFATDDGARMYRTGDQARWRADGVLEFLGRLDGQVKLRGYRIELGEIESVLTAHPSVAEAAVVLDAPPASEPRLVAYIVPAAHPSDEPARPDHDASSEDPHERGTADLSAIRTALRGALPEYMVPALIVPCERLPRTPNGKLDRSALPSPGVAPRDPSGDAPRDAVEQSLARIFEKVLGIAGVGSTDDFFDLGGHSILALRLVGLIEHDLGRVVPLGMLFRSPTVRQLASIVRDGAHASRWSSLVPIRAGHDHPPFFCVHAVGGHVMNLRDLLMRLPAEQPVYALQARGMSGDAPPADSLEEMARHYLSEIRTVQPTGPYYLGGLSLGGVIAFEMALQLEAGGETAALVALLDTHLHHRFLPRHLRVYFRIMKAWRFASMLVSRSAREKRSHLFGVAGHALRRARASGNGKRMQPGDDGTASLDEIQRLIALAFRYYTPRPFGGRLTLLRAADRHPDIPSDPAIEWPPWALDGVDIHNVPGDHMSMFEPPNVEALTRRLARCLEEARWRHAR